MPKTTSKTSDPEEGSSSDRSVLDFLYHDSRRIASFLSQFEVGHLQQLTQTKDGAKSKVDTSETEVKGSLGVAGGTYKGSTARSVDLSQGYSKVFDPHWSNARAFLDYANERDLIQTDLEAAAMGQFVLVKGSLIITDLQMMQAVWQSDTVRRFVKASIQAEQAVASTDIAAKDRSAKAKREIAAKQSPSEIDLVLELLPHFPHSSQLHLVTGDNAVWGTIEDGAMVGNISDLILKHGAKIAGEWSMLGILDGRPWEVGDLPTAMEMIRVAGSGATVSKMPLDLAPHIRQLLGRPLLSYGMTPLLVFREVA